MTLTGDWQIEIASRSFFASDDAANGLVLLDDPAPKGFLAQKVLRTSDKAPVGHGVAFGTDYYGSRLLSFAIGAFSVHGDLVEPAAAARDLFRVAVGQWGAGDQILRLDAQLPGSAETVMSYFGRPRDVTEGPSVYGAGALVALLEFAAEPWAYGAQRTNEAEITTSFTIESEDAGDPGTTSTRVVIVIDANGGTPVITHSATDVDGRVYERDITFLGAVSVDTTLTLGPTEQTAMQGATSVIGQVSDASRWPELVGGVDNTFTVSGCAGIDISWRPAYY